MVIPKPDRSDESIPKRVPGGNRPRRREMHAGFLNGRSPDSLRRRGRTASPGSAGVPPAAAPCRPSRRRRRRPLRRPGARSAMEPFPVDRSRRVGPGCAKPWAGGTPALPGGVSRDVVELCGITRPGRPADSCRCRRNSMPRCMTRAASQGLRRVVSSCGPRLESRTKLFQ